MYRLRLLGSAVAVFAAVCVATALPPAPRSGPAPAAATSAPASQKLSHARIVRLSLAQGAEIQQWAGAGWLAARPNMPITEGEALRTGASGRAEVEFEDGSTARLIPNSRIVFQQLALTPKGVRLNGVSVMQGGVFFNLHPKDSQAFRAIFPEGVATVPRKKAEFEIYVSGQQARVQMLNGHAEIAAAGQPYALNKGDLLTLDEQAPAELAKSKANSTWDQWNHQRDEVMEADASRQGPDFHGDAWYGMGMLSGYGNWDGNLWYPAGMAMGWSPFMNGAWSYDPAFGDMWDSYYPWGWAPYHYGEWLDTAAGWAWSPMGGMMFETYPMAVYAGGGSLALPPRPATPATALHRNPVPGITVVRSAGVTAPQRILATRAWNAMQARAAAEGRANGALRSAKRSGQYSRAQMNAKRLAARTQQRDLERMRGPVWARQSPRDVFGPQNAAPGEPMRAAPMRGLEPGPARGSEMGGPPMGASGGGTPHGGGVIRH